MTSLQPEVSSEAEEVTIMHLINKYGLSARGRLEAASSSSTSFIAELDPATSAGSTDIQYRLQGPSSYDHNTILSLGMGKGIQKLVPEVMAALERVLGLSSSQILKIYERATEGLRMRFRYQHDDEY